MVYPDGTVICKDLDDKSYLFRILAVMSGEKWCHPKSWYSKELQDKLKKRAKKVARELIKEGKANRVVFVDDVHFKFPHFHIQVCLQ
ncbi:unnamed protein product [marine sediment metagenome]|uniref:Uncharacterized protein n=1 Tax=marine sediment metagenome TaxID=412755 RepID=X0XTM3_9ZZZZ